MSRAKPRWFTVDEDAFLLENAGLLSPNEMGEQLGRSPNTVYNRLARLRKGGGKPRRQWTAAEDEHLLSLHREEVDVAAMVTKLGRTKAAIEGRLHKLGLTDAGIYTPGEIAVLKRMWGAVPSAKIAERLGRSRLGVMGKAEGLGLPVQGERCPYITPGELADAMGVTARTPRNWIHNGKLAAKKLYLGDTHHWYITPDDAEAFARENPDKWRTETHTVQLWKLLEDKRFNARCILWGTDVSPTTKRARRVPEHLRGELALFMAEVAEAWRAKGGGAKLPDWVAKLSEAEGLGRRWVMWTSAEDRRLRRLFMRGATYAEVAEELGRTRSGVAHRLRTAEVLKGAG